MGAGTSVIRFAVSIAGQEVGVTVCPVRDDHNAVTRNWFLAGHSLLSQPEMEPAQTAARGPLRQEEEPVQEITAQW
jgi:hypothetical protein